MCTAPTPSPPSPSRSTPDHERLLAGEHRPRRSTRFYNRLTPVVLRRPLELGQYLSIRYTERLAEAGIERSVGSVGDSYDNALAETVIGLFTKTTRQCSERIVCCSRSTKPFVQ